MYERFLNEPIPSFDRDAGSGSSGRSKSFTFACRCAPWCGSIRLRLWVRAVGISRWSPWPGVLHFAGDLRLPGLGERVRGQGQGRNRLGSNSWVRNHSPRFQIRRQRFGRRSEIPAERSGLRGRHLARALACVRGLELRLFAGSLALLDRGSARRLGFVGPGRGRGATACLTRLRSSGSWPGSGSRIRPRRLPPRASQDASPLGDSKPGRFWPCDQRHEAPRHPRRSTGRREPCAIASDRPVVGRNRWMSDSKRREPPRTSGQFDVLSSMKVNRSAIPQPLGFTAPEVGFVHSPCPARGGTRRQTPSVDHLAERR